MKLAKDGVDAGDGEDGSADRALIQGCRTPVPASASGRTRTGRRRWRRSPARGPPPSGNNAIRAADRRGQVDPARRGVRRRRFAPRVAAKVLTHYSQVPAASMSGNRLLAGAARAAIGRARYWVRQARDRSGAVLGTPGPRSVRRGTGYARPAIGPARYWVRQASSGAPARERRT